MDVLSPIESVAFLQNQAEDLEEILPSVLRRLFPLDENSPVSDLSVAQLKVCRLLRAGPKLVTHVAEELSITASAVTQLADRMERAGWVERVSETDDRRIRLLRLTQNGAAMMQLRRDHRVAHALSALSRLKPEQRHMLLTSLHSLYHSFEEDG